MVLKQLVWTDKVVMGLAQMAIQAQFNQMLHGCALNQAFDLVLEPSSTQGNPLLVHVGFPCPAPQPGIFQLRRFLPPATTQAAPGEFHTNHSTLAH